MLTHMDSAHANIRLAGWLKTESLVWTGITPPAPRISERQHLPFAVQRLKDNRLHCTMSSRDPTLVN